MCDTIGLARCLSKTDGTDHVFELLPTRETIIKAPDGGNRT